jgi:hypothetical protein
VDVMAPRSQAAAAASPRPAGVFTCGWPYSVGALNAEQPLIVTLDAP